MSAVVFLVPAGIDDPTRPSGGNRYDRRIAEGMPAWGWTVTLIEIDGVWPDPGPRSPSSVHDQLAGLPDATVVLIDGLVASGIADVLVAHRDRLRLVLLAHMPGLGMRERRVVEACRAVVTTSSWTRRWLESEYGIAQRQMHVVEPGTDRADLALPTHDGGRLLCVGVLAPHKGQDVLVRALARVCDLDWTCRLIGSHDVDPGFVAEVRRLVDDHDLSGRVELSGPARGDALERSYASADLLIAPSWNEAFGMVVTEGLARGIPVICTAAGGLPEALGVDAHGRRPGLLVPPGDSAALGDALRRWLHDDAVRTALRTSARERRRELTGWPRVARSVAAVLHEVAA